MSVCADVAAQPNTWCQQSPESVETMTSGGVQPSTRRQLSPEDDPDTIHIFSVASGHMYERLQKIMILSVIRTTRSAARSAHHY